MCGVHSVLVTVLPSQSHSVTFIFQILQYNKIQIHLIKGGSNSHYDSKKARAIPTDTQYMFDVGFQTFSQETRNLQHRENKNQPMSSAKGLSASLVKRPLKW